jgi:hypothetical protein
MLCKQSVNLHTSQVTVSIFVNSLEGLMDVEVTAAAKSLSEEFCALFHAQVGSNRGKELVSRLPSEKQGTVEVPLHMVSGSSLKSLGSQVISRPKSIAEVCIKHPAVPISIIASHKQAHIIFMRETAKIIERFLEFLSSDPALGVFIDHAKSIHEVEVGHGSETALGLLELLVESELLNEGANELLLLVELQIRTSHRVNIPLLFLSEATSGQLIAIRGRQVSLSVSLGSRVAD